MPFPAEPLTPAVAAGPGFFIGSISELRHEGLRLHGLDWGPAAGTAVGFIGFRPIEVG
ncbi:hypothetical protein IMZ48_31625 [Candidatus Bathyarchaeota archaeon]|nr:hypothetical protein [Candidatus Bathyarchaeota archaeon]